MSWFQRLTEAAQTVHEARRDKTAVRGAQVSRSLLGDLPRGGSGDRVGELPDARFHEPDPLSDNVFVYDPEKRPAALFAGVVAGQVVNPKDPAKRYVIGGVPVGIEDNRHRIMVAGTRSGKGRSAIVPVMLDYRGSVIATDPKGELAMMTASHRAEKLGHDVYVLDPFGVVKGPASAFRCGFNPLEAIRPESFAEDAGLIADAIVAEVNDKEPHWDAGSRAFIEGVILHVKTDDRYLACRNLAIVYDTILRGAFDPEKGARSLKPGLFNEMVNNPAANGAVQAAALEFFERSDREYSSMLSTVRRHLRFLSYPGIQDVVSDHKFDLEYLKLKPTTIYLCLPARTMGTCAGWLRMFINIMLQRMEENLAPPVGMVPVLAILDEFATLGRMRQIEDAAGQIAGFGLKLWVILQDLGQLKSLYGDRWETFMGNAGVMQFFGNSDLTTLKWVSERLGKTTVITQSDKDLSAQQAIAGGQQSSRSQQTESLMTVDEVASTFRRNDTDLRQLIIHNDYRWPLITQRVNYDQHALFAGKAAPADGFPTEAARRQGYYLTTEQLERRRRDREALWAKERAARAHIRAEQAKAAEAKRLDAERLAAEAADAARRDAEHRAAEAEARTLAAQQAESAPAPSAGDMDEEAAALMRAAFKERFGSTKGEAAT